MTDEEKTKIKNIIKDLKKNPVFNMSLSGKEIFHSNVLAWLLSETDNNKNPTQTSENLSKIFCPKRSDNNNVENQNYKVLTVLREKNNFDLLIVYYLREENDDNNEETTQIKEKIITLIEDNENRSQFEEDFEKIKKDKLENFLKNCRFVIIENKFKAIPDASQLDRYYLSIPNWKLKRNSWEDSGNIKLVNISTQNGEKIDLSLKEENTTFYLLAPQKALNLFVSDKNFYTNSSEYTYTHQRNKKKVDDKKTIDIKWYFISYEDYLKNIKTIEQNEFILNHYKNFTNTMIKLADDIIDIKKTTPFYAFEEPIKFLKTIRIHDFYEKLWFTAANHMIKTVLDKDPNTKNIETHISYSNGMGMLNYKYTFAQENLKKARYGIEIQGKQFRIFVHTANTKEDKWKSAIEKNLKKEKERNIYPEIFDWLYKIYKDLDFSDKKEENELDLGRFDEFKYLKFNLDPTTTVDKLTEMVSITIQNMRRQQDNFFAKLE